MEKIGFIGLGIMGSRMAANLQKAGYPLVVYNRTRGRAEELIKNGAVWGESPAGVARQVDVLLTMLSTPNVVKSVASGKAGFLGALPEGKLWIDCSTVNPSFSREMAGLARQSGVRFVDAPVVGSKVPVTNAQVTFVVGGEAADVEACQPILRAMGRKVIHAGENGSGAALKMVFNLLLGTSMLALVEALALGQGLGLTRESIFNALDGAIVVAPSAMGKRAQIEGGQYEAEFPLQWMQKDLQLASVSAWEEHVALPMTNAAKEVYMQAIRAGLGEKDLSAVYKVLAEPLPLPESES